MEETGVPIEIDVEEMPKILQSSPNRKSENYEVDRFQNDYEEVEVLTVSKEAQEGIIKQLNDEKESIARERDEKILEYEDEIKGLTFKNEEISKENIELKQELKILRHQVENFKMNEQFLESLQKTNSELKTELKKTQEIISDLQETNRNLTKNMSKKIYETTEEPKNAGKSTMKELIMEKNKLLEKFIEIDAKYSEKLREIDELRGELVFTKLKYAESETTKDLIYKKLIDKASIVN